MKLAIGLDVEEAGLFSGRYLRKSGVTNVAELRRLEFIPREFGLLRPEPVPAEQLPLPLLRAKFAHLVTWSELYQDGDEDWEGGDASTGCST